MHSQPLGCTSLGPGPTLTCQLRCPVQDWKAGLCSAPCSALYSQKGHVRGDWTPPAPCLDRMCNMRWWQLTSWGREE